MIWKSILSAAFMLAHLLLALAAPQPDLGASPQSSDRYVFAHFMVSNLTNKAFYLAPLM